MIFAFIGTEGLRMLQFY